MPVTDAQLTTQRFYATRALRGRCRIERQDGTTQNDMGETIPAWVEVAADVPCTLVSTMSVTGRERERLAAIGQVTEWALALPWDTDLTSRDKVTVAGSPERVFTVSQVGGPHTDAVRLLATVEETS